MTGYPSTRKTAHRAPDIVEIFALIAHLVSTLVRMALPGGVRAVIVESLLLKHQLLVLSRSRKRAPRLTPLDRLQSPLDQQNSPWTRSLHGIGSDQMHFKSEIPLVIPCKFSAVTNSARHIGAHLAASYAIADNQRIKGLRAWPKCRQEWRGVQKCREA
jgi:hypothetical protein